MNVLENTAEITRKRARLAELDAALARLHAQYELLMNAFKFDEARAIVAPTEAAEREQAELAKTLPPNAPPRPTPFVVARRRRR